MSAYQISWRFVGILAFCGLILAVVAGVIAYEVASQKSSDGETLPSVSPTASTLASRSSVTVQPSTTTSVQSTTTPTTTTISTSTAPTTKLTTSQTPAHSTSLSTTTTTTSTTVTPVPSTTTTTSTTAPTTTTTEATTTTTTEAPTTTSVLPEMTEEEKARVDCWPEAKYGVDPANHADCMSRGCTWGASPRPDVPDCYVSDQSPMGFGYEVTDMDWVVYNETGVRIKMVPNNGPRGSRNSDQMVEEFVIFEATFYDENLLNFKIYKESTTAYEVPRDLVNLNLPIPAVHPTRRPRYQFNITSYDPFHFQVTRRSNGRLLWDSSIGGLVVTDQLNAISTKLPSEFIYGLGENRHRSFKHETDFQTWGMFARDQSVSQGNRNHYGVQPFYTCMENDGLTHGLLLLNSNAMDYSLSPLPALTFRTIGGVLDFYMFLGPDPEHVVQQYTGLVGRPFMPPYWALGFQQSRFGYNNLQNMTKSVERTLNADIPLDVQYADIDHYDKRRVFTIDDEAFDGLPEYFDSLREKGMRTVITLNTAFKINEPGYEPYQKGLENDIYIKWPSREMMPPADFDETNTTAMLGYLWPGKVVFPDFSLPATGGVWSDLIVKHRDNIPFDGLLLDMNEPANFGTNDYWVWNMSNAEPDWSLKCPNNQWEDPPFRTMNEFAHDKKTLTIRGSKSRLSDRTLCMSAVQGNGTYRHYDVHSLYGTTTVPPTLSGLREASGERGLVMTRSTFVGSGRLAGHWLGHNYATWSDLKDSIISMLEFNLFGIPYVGANICGYWEETNANLCKRWLQLGAFYPHSRTHNNINSVTENDPASFDDQVTAVVRDAIMTRYRLLPYLYTLFHQAHVYGSTVIRPLHHEFPTDVNARSISHQFMWGKAILFCPILEDDSHRVHQFYMPKGLWYDFKRGYIASSGEGRFVSYTVFPNLEMPIFARGGNILVLQDSANNTRYSRTKPFHLKVYLNEYDTNPSAKAIGELYWDDGVGINTFENDKYYHVEYYAEQRRVRAHILHNGMENMDRLYLADITIMGVMVEPALILINGKYDHLDFTYSFTDRMLSINNLDWKMDANLDLEYRFARLPNEEEKQRVDCMPGGVSAGSSVECVARGCIWSLTAGPTGVPRCFIDREKVNYNYMSETSEIFGRGHVIQLNHTGVGSVMPDPIDRLQVNIQFRETDILRIKIGAVSDMRYEVPVTPNLGDMFGILLSTDYQVEYEKDPSKGFYIKVRRTSTGTVVWDTSIGGLSFSDQYLQISTTVPSTRLYGLGEHRHQTFKHAFDYKTWPLFSREEPPITDERNLYGVHPYYTCVEDDEGNAHGVLLMNSNAMEVALQPTPAVTYRTTGGILDFYIMFGEDSEMVSRMYSTVVGYPFLPPYWALGFQVARSGYENTEGARQQRMTMERDNIPQDVQYFDIEHTSENKVFTINEDNFGDLGEYVDTLKNKSYVHTIIRLDPAIYASGDYQPYIDGAAGKVFVTWPENSTHPDIDFFGNDFIHGYAWPKGPVVYPDFLNSDTQDWWKNLITTHRELLAFDGLLIETNEPTRYDSPQWGQQTLNDWSLTCPENDLDDPPYKPGTIVGDRLSDQTLCMIGRQHSSSFSYSHYDVHNIYGLIQSAATLRAVNEARDERSLVISRSTFPSSGSVAGHSLGDNEATWNSLADSIIGILEFNLFGIPYVGADICGYKGTPSIELCIRWLQLGAFYPLSRSNSAKGSPDRGPSDFGPVVADAARNALRARYMLLPYLYTLFYYTHTEGGTVVRALFHEFPADPLTYDIDTQFLWGPALLVSPVLSENVFDRLAYFPEGRWFEYFLGTELIATNRYRTVLAPIDFIPLHIRGGHIIVQQLPDLNTHLSRQNDIHLVVAPNENGTAAGQMFYDDGVSTGTIERKQYCLWDFELYTTEFGHAVKFTVKHFYPYTEKESELLRVNSLRVLGLPSTPKYVSVRLQHIYPANHDLWVFNENNKELLIYNLLGSLILFDQANEWTVFWGW